MSPGFAPETAQLACVQMTQMAPDDIVKGIEGCLDKTDCGEFVSCFLPWQEKMFMKK